MLAAEPHCKQAYRFIAPRASESPGHNRIGVRDEVVGMSQGSNRAAPVRTALTKAEAAQALGVSVRAFERHVLPEVRTVRQGRRRVIPVAELEQWIESATLPPLT